MLKKVTLLVVVFFTLSSCVSKKVYQELETKFNKLRASNSALIKEKQSLLSAKKALELDLAKLQKEYDALLAKKQNLDNEYTALKSKYNKLDASYAALSTQSSQKLADQAKKNQELLKQLEEKEKTLLAESTRLEKLQKELEERSNQIAELQALINAKEAQMQKLKDAISKALHNFEGKGLTVVQKNGKIYVSMENKLLFGSGSWAVGAEGKKAVQQLAKVLSENKDINVLIEGHTDNVPYKGATLIDNWDLSVKRATAIVRILQNKGVDPTQITAAGRSEFLPIDSNKSAKGKAKNRRIEIILAPNLDEISKLLND
ncbi:chemotaxis protein MotB [Lutibacter oricola]|uniref:Chemotaxis protein MotB n=1 Tax=Lutibacter oricola TaxID=762486 RepID=A0A1H2R1A1_9FLAO|nr:OmpA family protein [Lutibacter oricola]SDW13242.1 chemotaxis protein MotB [Lutibacter oricola]